MAGIAPIGKKDQERIEKHTEKMKERKIPFKAAIHASYDYDPLSARKNPTMVYDIYFWPPTEEDSQQQRIMKTKLDAAKAEWKKTAGYSNLRTLLTALSKDVEITKIVGLNIGSLTGLKPFSEEAQHRKIAQSYTQLAIVLVMQEELKNGPKLILQNPAYGDNGIDFMTKSGIPGGVHIMNDPEGFNQIDEKTIFNVMGGYSSFWYRVQNGPPPIAIITDHLDIRIGIGPMLKVQEDLLNKYKAQEIAPKGTEGLSVNWATKFWTACG